MEEDATDSTDENKVKTMDLTATKRPTLPVMQVIVFYICNIWL